MPTPKLAKSFLKKRMAEVRAAGSINGAALRDVETWRDRRDALVTAALTAMVQSGTGMDPLAMQRALAAAFEEAARQEMERFGAGLPWVALSRTAARLSAP